MSDHDAPVFWTVEGPSYVFRVSDETARRIDAELTAAIVEFIRFDDLEGAPCIYRRERILGLWRSSPESRAILRTVNAALDAELPQRIPGTDD